MNRSVIMLAACILLAGAAACLPADDSESNNDSKSIALDAATREKCVSILREGMQADDFWPATHAAEGLTLGGYGAEVLAFLEERLVHETDDQRRCGIAREMVRAGDKAKSQVMLDILAGEDSHGHVHAAESLYKVVEIGDGTVLRKVFNSTDNIRLKLMAAGALGRCGNPAAMDFLRQSLGHEDLEVMRIAVWILGRIGDQTDIPQIKAQLPRCDLPKPDPLLKSYVTNSLAALGDAAGLAALVENLHHDDPAVRTYAATFAGDAWATSTRDSLIQLLDDDHADTSYRAAQSLLVLSGSPPQQGPADVSNIVYEASAAHPRYTEGSIIALNDGSLLFAVTEFIGGDSDFAKAHIVARQSSDGGRSWDEGRVLQENTGGLNVMSVTLRRLPSGEIAMFYLQKESQRELNAYVKFSSDEAASFAAPILITDLAGYHVVNNDRVTQLSSGRLLVPAASTADVEQVNHFTSHCFISDDGGKSWRAGAGHVDAEKRGAMEPEVIELTDGRVMMLVRTQLGYPGKAYSEDGGETWGPLAPLGVQGPEAPTTLRRIPATGDLLLIWNNTYTEGAGHGGKRTPLTAALSRDEGQTWTVVNNLEEDTARTFSYTSLTFAGDRAVMSYWDNVGSRYSCRFRSLPVDWFYTSKR